MMTPDPIRRRNAADTLWLWACAVAIVLTIGGFAYMVRRLMP
jgi:hypothetical protein